MSFIWPRLLYSLLLIPFFVWGYLALRRQRQQRIAEWREKGLRLSNPLSELGQKRHLPALLYLAALVTMILALGRPQATIQLPRVEGTVILAFDISSSMTAEDFSPTRIEAAKAAAAAFVQNQPPSIQIGVVAFSSGGLVVTQPTNDQVEVLAAIDRLTPQGGTSLGQGLFSSINAVAGEPIDIGEQFDEGEPPADLSELLSGVEIGYFPSAVVVMLSDGENTGGTDPLAMAQLASNAGIRVFPVGIGTAEGTMIEVDGFQIVTRLNEELLTEIARQTDGAYFSAGSPEELQNIYETIDLRLTIRGEKTEISAVFAAAALFFLVLGLVLSMIWIGRVP